MKNISKKKIWQAENLFYLKSDTSRLSKLIYQYELFKLIKDVPGAFLVFGVFKGSSFIRFLTYRNLLENSNSREFYGFDLFSKFPKKKQNSQDLKFIRQFEKDAGYSISKSELENALKEKNFTNFKLIEGDIKNTLLSFLKKNQSLKVAMLHLDLDTYEITKFTLKNLFAKVARNGIIIIDDYLSNFGATKAIDEFLKKNPYLKIKKMSFYNKPSYIIKN